MNRNRTWKAKVMGVKYLRREVRGYLLPPMSLKALWRYDVDLFQKALHVILGEIVKVQQIRQMTELTFELLHQRKKTNECCKCQYP